MRTTFLVGRLMPRSTEIMIVTPSREASPIPGPWSLRAMTRPKPPALPENPPSP
jgi:hypothetical protein